MLKYPKAACSSQMRLNLSLTDVNFGPSKCFLVRAGAERGANIKSELGSQCRESRMGQLAVKELSPFMNSGNSKPKVVK